MSPWSSSSQTKTTRSRKLQQTLSTDPTQHEADHWPEMAAVGQQAHTANTAGHHSRYKIGDAFFHVKVEQAQEMLSTATEKLEGEVEELEEKLGTTKEEMQELKVQLYARFGRSINLET